jgi:DNA invertase Pin-like site-specific DNA recombinase
VIAVSAWLFFRWNKEVLSRARRTAADGTRVRANRPLVVGLSDADAEKWSSLFDQIALAKTGATAPQKRPTTIYRKTVRKLRQQQKRHDASEIAQLVAGYQAGSTIFELAEQFGCHHETVCRRLKTEGVQMRGRQLTPAQVDEAERLYTAGHSLASVGEQLGVWSSTIRKHLRNRGVVMRPPHIRQTLRQSSA